ncbi:hypothetical protein SFRURICE_001259 [Spodoptera frugiperda]|nr:hypothetical protein SFRURICE_001259 [Spodoptera frugiperda]
MSSSSDSDYQPPSIYDRSGAESTSSESCLSSDDGIPMNEPREAAQPQTDWHLPNGSRQKQFTLDIQPGIHVPDNCDKELDIFRLFLNQDIMTLMVQMTNSYANKVKILKVVTRHMRLAKWVDCNDEEMLKFLGLLIYMGLKKLPKMSDYWSNNILYKNKVASQAMSRNRFELLLRCWHFEDNKRDVFALSTKHYIGFVTVQSRRNPNKKAMKPTLIAEYNKHKCSIDLSDQMASYANPARRNIRWFQKLALSQMHIHIIYKTHKQLSSKKYNITNFRENLCLQMLGITSNSNSAAREQSQRDHKFSKSLMADHRGRLIRRRCIHCYERNRAAGLSAKAARDRAKKVNTVCLKCPTQPSVCGQCYGEIHIFELHKTTESCVVRER